MKNFEIPEIVTLDLTMTETDAFGSGTTGGNSNITDYEKDDWKVYTIWCNHNTGSHSELKVVAHNYGSKSGSALKMSFVNIGFNMTSLTPGQGAAVTVSNQTATSFDLTWRDAINPNQEIGFVMQLTCSDGPKHPETGHTGAVGITGQACDKKVICTSAVLS